MEREPEKTALDRFREGKAAKKAREEKERQEAEEKERRALEETGSRGESENGDAATPADADGLELPQLRDGTKILPECRDPGKCHHCEKPFAASSRVVWEPPEGRGAEARIWGPGCCQVAQALLARFAQTA